jgi:signal transduction histidine kinase/CheY-like chemotaxis protein
MDANPGQTDQRPKAANVQRGRPTLQLILALLLPVLVLVVVQVTVLVGDARAAAESAAMRSARDIVSRADVEVAADLRALAAVAQSVRGVPISRSTPPPERAAYNAEVFPQWSGVLIWSRPERTVLFSSLPLPELPEIPASWGEAIPASGASVIGGVERVGDLPVALLHRPTPEDPRDLVLTLAVKTETYQDILMSELPKGAVAALVDRQGNFIARSVDIERRVATPATEFVRNAMVTGESGVYRGRTYEGFENYTAFFKSPVTGWSAHVAISNELIDAPRSSAFIVAIVGGLLCITLMGGLIFLLLEDGKRRRQAEQNLAQAQKLETLGLLTGGIAHDFNNLLTVMIGSLEKLKRKTGGPTADADAQRAIETALRSARQAAGLTSSLLSYSRQQTLAPRVVDVNAFMTNMCDIVSRTVGEAYDVGCQTDDTVGLVEVDESQLGAAVLNLAVNARDAMPDGGSITFLTRPVSKPSGDARLKLQAGEYTRITVKDNGPGMPPNVLARAFEPFFSTKGLGRGTGLGLAQVEGFLRQSGGAADIESAPGKGTSVHLYLPRSGKRLAEAHGHAPVQHQQTGVSLKILLVEDEREVRNNSAELLRDLGHTVVACASSAEGLAALGAGTFDLLFTDVILGGEMNGVELSEAAQRLQPKLRVLLTTGYARNVIHDDATAKHVLLKPYDRESLVRSINEVMQKSSGGAGERILLVEDEPLIRMMAVEALEDAGLQVVEAGTAAEALASFEADLESFALAMVDLGLPDQPGDQLIAALRSRRPDLPILVASGSDGSSKALVDAITGAQALRKPYSPDEMVAAVKRIIGAA